MGQDNAESPGSGGASPYQRRGLLRVCAPRLQPARIRRFAVSPVRDSYNWTSATVIIPGAV
jgi:hypothetical protein